MAAALIGRYNTGRASFGSPPQDGVDCLSAFHRVARRGIFNTKNEGCGILEMWWIGGITMVF